MLEINQLLTDLMCASCHQHGRHPPPPAGPAPDLRKRVDAYLAELFQVDTVIGKFPMQD